MTTRLRHLITFSLLFAFCAVPIFAEDHLGLPPAKPESVGMSSEKLGAIEQQLGAFVENGQLPGFVTVVARQGKVVHFEAFGQRDVERGLPMEKDTIFRMYSMTKPVTGAAVMTLVDDGKIKVTDPVSKYLPEFTDMTVLVESEDGSTETVPAESPVTIHHLLTHTGGLIYGLFDTGALGKLYVESGINSDGASGMTLEEFSKAVAKMPLKAQPGTEWHYGVSMDVLGRVVEVVTGQRYADYLAERIFEPLGMEDSGFYVLADKVDRFACNYEPENGGMALLEDSKTSPFLKKPSQDSGGGGMVGTAADYLRFAQMLLNGGELDGVRVLSEEAAQEMTTNQLGSEFGNAPLGTLMAGIPFNGIGFGYTGAVVMDGVKQTIFGGEGEYSWGGYASTDFWIDEKEQIVGLVLTQLIPTGTYPTRIVMRNATYAAITESYADEKPGD